MSGRSMPPLWIVSLLLLLGLLLATGVSFGQLNLSARATAQAAGPGAGDDGGGDPDNPVPFTGGDGGDANILHGAEFELQPVDPALSQSVWDDFLLVWASVTGALEPILHF